MGEVLDKLRYTAASTGTGTLTVTIEELNAVHYAHLAALRRAKAEGWREAVKLADKPVCRTKPFATCVANPIKAIAILCALAIIVVLLFKCGRSACLEQGQLPPEKADLDSGGNHQAEGKDGSKAGIERQIPIERRFFFALFGIASSLFLDFVGGYLAFQKNRVVLGATLIGGGLLLAGSGLFLFWMTNFAWTWGWIL